MQIRPATFADIPSIMQLERQSATAGHWTEEQYRQAIRPRRRDPTCSDRRRFPAARVRTRDRPRRNESTRFLNRPASLPEWELENIVVAPSCPPKGAREAPSPRTAVGRTKNKQYLRVSRGPRIQHPRPNSLRNSRFRADRPPQVLLHKSLRRRHPLPPHPPLTMFLTLRLHHFFGIEPVLPCASLSSYPGWRSAGC